MITTRTVPFGVTVFHDVGSVVISVGGLGEVRTAIEILTADQARELAQLLTFEADQADAYTRRKARP